MREHNILEFPPIIRDHENRIRVMEWSNLVLWVLVMAIIFALVIFNGCSSFSQSGYARAGLYPRHNEAVDGQTQRITKWRGELSQSLRYGRVEVNLNPVLRLDNSWPEGSYGYQWNVAVLEGNLEVRLYLAEPVYIYYRKTRHWLLGHKLGNLTDREVCQCTYWNEVGLQFNW